MDKDKRVIEKFKNDMGFEDCSIKKSETEESGLVHKTVTQKIEVECTNSYEDKFKCSTSINAGTDEIIKSDCEKEDSQEN